MKELFSMDEKVLHVYVKEVTFFNYREATFEKKKCGLFVTVLQKKNQEKTFKFIFSLFFSFLLLVSVKKSTIR